MGTHNICLYKEVDKKVHCCNLKTTKLLDCLLIGVCAVITGRLNKVYCFIAKPVLTITTLYVNSADNKLMIFSYFYQKTGFDISCKLSA